MSDPAGAKPIVAVTAIFKDAIEQRRNRAVASSIEEAGAEMSPRYIRLRRG
jgi:hypothetical protein